MTCRSILLSASLLAVTSACSGQGGTAPGDVEGLDAETDGAVLSDDSDVASDPGGPSSDATTPTHDAGSAPRPRDGGTAAVVDAGIERLACYRAALGVCQSEPIAADAAAAWRADCKFQGGTSDPCSTSGLVGCCIGDSNHYCYYSQDFTLATAKQDCAVMNGTWSTSL
jgi:hypothetical protein